MPGTSASDLFIGPRLVLGLQYILGCDAVNRRQLRAVFYVR